MEGYVEELRTLPAEAVEEADRGIDEAERRLKADADAAVLGVREEEEEAKREELQRLLALAREDKRKLEDDIL